MKRISLGIFFFLCFAPSFAFAGSIDGKELSLSWGIPFALTLLSLAICPIFIPKIWHHHYGKITGILAIAFILPFYAIYGFSPTASLFVHAMLLEYIPFCALIFALFTITGGIRISGPFNGTPCSNFLILAVGTSLASIIGTTGAAMLLINPLIQANRWRAHKKHTIIFFIFLVANIGGSLTPLGDPPLFLGFLQGVPFFWTTVHLFPAFAIISTLLLLIYYGLDRHYFDKEKKTNLPKKADKYKIMGKRNIPLLMGVVFLVLLSGWWKNPMTFSIAGVYKPVSDLVRDLGVILLGYISFRISRPEDRKINEFSWEPILEIAKIFFTIFITVSPVIAILHAGVEGALSDIITLANIGGNPHNFAYFWLTGILSSFLDNAPTYLVFFHMAGGDPGFLTTQLAPTLTAISLGAVFMGAMTYIGNAPNFMVRAIAERRGIKMPSFFGYMLWSLVFLAPLFLIISFFL